MGFLVSGAALGALGALGGVPFGAFHYVPGSVFFGHGAPLIGLIGAPLAALSTMWLAQRAWNLGLASYESTGS